VYDASSNAFAVGNASSELFYGSPHERLAQAIGAGDDVVGGIFSRGVDGSIVTNEMSGHYGFNWTPQIREQFVNWLSSRTGIVVNHLPW